MASTPASAAPARAAPARRQPAARPAPPARAQRVRWTVAEKDQLKRYFEQAATTPVWSELAERLDTGRTWKQVQTMARQLELTEPTHRAAGGPAWEAQRCVQGAKDKKRKAPASAALTLASPAGVPPSEPRPKRPTAAAAALAIKQSALEGDAADTLTFFAGLDAEHHRRMDWARHYVLKLHAPSNREWDGRGGTVAIIRKEFGVPQGSTASIRSVLEDVSACYLRLLNDQISPTKKELVTDRNNCFGPVLREIRSHKGARVRGLGNSLHNGRRGEAMVDHEIERRGGAREKGPAQSARPLHPDAVKATKMFRAERLAKWGERQKQQLL